MMIRSMLMAIAAGLAASAGAQAPRGVVVQEGGFGTVRVVPPSPTGDVVSQRVNYRSVSEWYAQEEGLTVPEARKRLSEQMGFVPIFQRLEERLKRMEPDNYISARLNHQPDWSYTLFFKRDPEATLRRYSVNPRLKAASATMTEAELRQVAAPWLKRFAEARIDVVYGTDAIRGRIPITIPITRAAFDSIATREGWGKLPGVMQLSFAADHQLVRVDPRVAPLLRGFASERLATVMQMEAGFGGRVILDNGCLRLAGKGNAKGPLVVFHRETGIGLDGQGYLAVIDRRTGKAKGRIGEMWSWAGPNLGKEFDGLEELKAACGEGAVVNVGNPESEARFEARHAKRK